MTTASGDGNEGGQKAEPRDGFPEQHKDHECEDGAHHSGLTPTICRLDVTSKRQRRATSGKVSGV